MGSRGLSAKGVNKSGKTPTTWEISSKNAKDYNIWLQKRSAGTKGFSQDYLDGANANLDLALNTINKMGTMLGMRPDDMARVIFQYGAYDGPATGGDAVIVNALQEYGVSDDIIDKKTGEIKFSPEAKIRLFIPGLYDNNGDSAAHEMIHAMEAKWILQDYSKTSDRVNAWVEHTYSKSICYNALVSLGKQKDTGTIDDTVWKSNAQTIYRSTWEKNNPADAYAAVNYAETITSTVQAALRYGEKNISPYGQAILKELRKEIKRHRRRGGKQ